MTPCCPCLCTCYTIIQLLQTCSALHALLTHAPLVRVACVFNVHIANVMTAAQMPGNGACSWYVSGCRAMLGDAAFIDD